MIDFASIITAWPRPSIRTFADDLGIPYVNAQVMKHRNSIPPEYWDRVVEAAAERGLIGITLEHLQQLSARRRKPAYSQKRRVGNAHVMAA